MLMGHYCKEGEFNNCPYYQQIDGCGFIFKDSKNNWRAGFELGIEERSYFYNQNTGNDIPLSGWKYRVGIADEDETQTEESWKDDPHHTITFSGMQSCKTITITGDGNTSTRFSPYLGAFTLCGVENGQFVWVNKKGKYVYSFKDIIHWNWNIGNGTKEFGKITSVPNSLSKYFDKNGQWKKEAIEFMDIWKKEFIEFIEFTEDSCEEESKNEDFEDISTICPSGVEIWIEQNSSGRKLDVDIEIKKVDFNFPLDSFSGLYECKGEHNNAAYFTKQDSDNYPIFVYRDSYNIWRSSKVLGCSDSILVNNSQNEDVPLSGWELLVSDSSQLRAVTQQDFAEDDANVFVLSSISDNFNQRCFMGQYVLHGEFNKSPYYKQCHDDDVKNSYYIYREMNK